MGAAAFIVGDWGASHLRLALCDASGVVMQTREEPGAAASRGRFAEVFDTATHAWRGAHGELPAQLCGMVGSSFGWQEAPYLPCPVAPDDLAQHSIAVREKIHVVPGLRCSNPLGAPDVMRGEETQLLGALRIDASLGAGKRLICLPGTHTKWVLMHDGMVEKFITVPTGELFALLCHHSMLVRDGAVPIEHRAAEFELGLIEAGRHSQLPLLPQLFQARSLRLHGELAPEGAAAWMSGLLVGSDVTGSVPLFDVSGTQPVCVVGALQLSDHYALALTRNGHAVRRVDGAAAAFAGLAYCHLLREQMA